MNPFALITRALRKMVTALRACVSRRMAHPDSNVTLIGTAHASVRHPQPRRPHKAQHVPKAAPPAMTHLQLPSAQLLHHLER